MERLTVKWTDKIYDTLDPVDILNNEYSKTNYNKLLTKLGEYEDLEEQGLLLRLPCKVGDAVWDSHYGKPCAYTITGFSFGAGEYYIDEPVTEKEVVCYCSNSNENITISFAVSEIGKTVFLTQAEAEQKLKEMEKVEKR